MPHANIWIRVDNVERWNSITDKSAWVNAYLEKSPPNSVVIKEQLEPGFAVDESVRPKPIIKTPAQAKDLVSDFKSFKDKDLCPHGFSRSARMCKKGCV